MDIGTVMNTMRDPAGVPAHPVLFQGLMILTWVFHIAFVHLTMGAAALAIYAFHRRDKGEYWERLSMALTKVVLFDRFHVAKHLGEAVNDVRKSEQRVLLAEGDERLKRTRFLWLMGPARRAQLDAERRGQFDALRGSTLKVARAWALKETARELWRYTHRGWALRGWQRWLGWAVRSRLEPMRKVARMLKEHLWGVVNAVVQGVTNATAESLNAKIQRVKKNACGFRNRERFRTAILFHCGGLDLYPRPANRGRNAHYDAPPAQNRAGPIRALGSHLG